MDKTGIELTNYIIETQDIANHALAKIDKEAKIRIIPSIDIGVPYDVDRLAGGFPTGVYVEWECAVPFIPVDTTVNCCSASIFKLSRFFDLDKFYYNLTNLNSTWDKSCYQMNFNRGNHFILLCRDMNENFYLIIHSTAKEFTKGYNGLYPIRGNWYYDKIQVYEENNRYFRYIAGNEAELFARTAISLNTYNEIRHENIGYYLCEQCGSILSVSHHHHYGMEQPNAIKIGCYTTMKNEMIPIFTKPNYPIDLFRVENSLQKTAGGKFIVPHGWGKAYKNNLNIKLSFKDRSFTIGSVPFELFTGKSLYTLKDLYIRDYVDENDFNLFYNVFSDNIKGTILMRLKQEICMTSAGVYKIH